MQNFPVPNKSLSGFQNFPSPSKLRWGFPDFRSSVIKKVVSALWTPAEITTALWLDADDSSTITLDGSSNVEQWNDKSGNVRHATQSTSTYRPALVTAALNGLDGVRGDGSNDVLGFSALDIARNVGAFSIFAVAKNSGGDTYRTIFSARTAVATVRTWVSFQSGSLLVGGRRLDGDSFQKVSLSQSGTSVCYGQFDFSNATLHIGLDGSALTARSGGFQTSGSTPDTDSSVVSIFADTSGSSSLNGDIYELIILQSVPSEADRQKTEGYLAWKWGLEANLPTGHPYEDAAPLIE